MKSILVLVGLVVLGSLVAAAGTGYERPPLSREPYSLGWRPPYADSTWMRCRCGLECAACGHIIGFKGRVCSVCGFTNDPAIIARWRFQP
jgi:hypothetical protein